MLFTLLSLLAIFLLITLAIRLIMSFASWASWKQKLRELVEGNHLDALHADEIRAFIKKLDQRENLKQLGKKLIGERPRLTREQKKALRAASRHARDAYLANVKLGWYQLVIIFLITSFFGLLLEETWMYFTAGLRESRVGLVWGPYSPIYGFGAVLLTILSWNLRKLNAKWWVVFIAGMVVGGLLEQIAGWGMENILGVISWDYTAVPGSITKWVAWPFLAAWGALGLGWSTFIMPDFIYRIGTPSSKRRVVFVGILAVYLVADLFMTAMCFGRMVARDQNIAPRNPFEEWVDTTYSDQFIAARFENLSIESATE